MVPRGPYISYVVIYSWNFAEFMRKIELLLMKTSLMHIMHKKNPTTSVANSTTTSSY